MNIFLLRHGIAVEPGTPGFVEDAQRPLTPKGKGKLKKIARAMERLELKFDLVLSSPYIRARQTAEIFARGLNIKRALEFSDALIPSGNLKKLIDVLNHLESKPQDLLLVGHEPTLSELISLLVSGAPGSSVLMKKGGLCKLCVSDLRHGRCATLEWLLTPKQMVLMA